MSDNQLLKVISTKTVFGSKADIQKLVLADEKGNHLLYRVFGEITGFVIGDSKFKRVDAETGEATISQWTKFAGDFCAINADGEVFDSAICFLPDYVGGPMVNSLREHGNNSIVFGFDIYAKFNATSATSYEFIAVPLKNSNEPSATDKMRAALPPMPTKQARLEGPKGKGK
jgi:hypothetical protein